MTPFTYSRAAGPAQAVRLAAQPGASYLGGGTNLVDLMRQHIARPAALVDVAALSASIDALPGGGLRIGAAASNTAVAEHAAVRTRWPLLARAILAGANGQIRNAATVAGNILQRTRCPYFYDVQGARCNKRTPGAGCDAIGGFNRLHAVLGASPACVATHPSDMCVALAALDAVVHLQGGQGTRSLPLAALHRLPGDTPQHETELAPGELITAVELPALAPSARMAYRKLRDRASFAFALVSVAAVLDCDGDGVVRHCRIALGGVAAKPWRAHAAEAVLAGRRADAAAFDAAAQAELAAARPLAGNVFKVELARRLMVDVLATLRDGHPEGAAP